MAIPTFTINGHDYTRYLKIKTGLQWERENTNAAAAGRDTSETMHTLVTSHQRKLNVTMGPMPFAVAQQLEADLEGNHNGVVVQYPDLQNGLFTRRLFYNTSISAAMTRFFDGEVVLDDIRFALITVKEATV